MIDYFVDHILEIIAIIVAIIIFNLQLRKKALTYTILTNTNLVSVSDNLKEDIKILYQDELVSNVQLIEMRITNAGKLPIRPDDYIEPLAIMYPEFSNPLSVEIIDKQRLGVTVDAELSNISQTVLSKTLLNPNDSFSIKVLLAEGSNILIYGRIVGVSKIESLKNRMTTIKRLLDILFVSLSSLFLVSLVMDWLNIVSVELGYVTFLLAASSLVFFVFFIVLQKFIDDQPD